MPAFKDLGFFTMQVFLRQEEGGPLTLNVWAGDDDTEATSEAPVANLPATSDDQVEIMVEILTKLATALQADKPTIKVRTAGKSIVKDPDFVPNSQKLQEIRDATDSLKESLDDLSSTVDKHLSAPTDPPKKSKSTGSK